MPEEMISTCHTLEFNPFGKRHIDHHPGPIHLQTRELRGQDKLIKGFSNVSIDDGQRQGTQNECWKLRAAPGAWAGSLNECGAGTGAGGGLYEEELYINNSTVVWSKGSDCHTKKLIKSFTVESPVIDAFWCTFVLPESLSNPNQDNVSLDTKGKIEECVCVLESTILNVYTSAGKEYIASLPFQVSRCWVSMNCLLFERKLTPDELSLANVLQTKMATDTSDLLSSNQTLPSASNQPLPILFSLVHPLDEVAPVICRTGGTGNSKVSYINETCQSIVFSSQEPSLVMTYDSTLGTHTIWKIRRAKVQEGYVAIGVMDSLSATIPQHPATPGPSSGSSSDFHSQFTLSSHSPSGFSPLRVSMSRLASPAGQSKSMSPSLSQLPMFSQSYSGSPLPAGSYMTQSPSQTRSPAAGIARTPVASNNSSSIAETYVEPAEPLLPELCMEQLWSESVIGARASLREGISGKTSKVFLSKDPIGQCYICYLIPSKNHLRCLKFEESNDRSQLIFGAVSIVPARDVAKLKNCYLILDLSFNLVLYTGITKVAKVHVPGLPMSSLSDSSTHLSPRFTGGTITPRLSDIGLSHLGPAVGMGRLSDAGIITSSRPASSMDIRFSDEVNLLSPVPTESMSNSQIMDESSHFIGLQAITSGLVASIKDSVLLADGKTFVVLELASGLLIKTRIPELTNSKIIMKCLGACRSVLPRDVALLVFTRWYSMRNSPGHDNNQSDWPLFMQCILGLMGYDIAKLQLTRQCDPNESLSPGISCKKSRPSDVGREEDWLTLLSSTYHDNFMKNYDPVSGLKPVVTATKGKPTCVSATIDTKAVLSGHIKVVLFALHLVYEECKLHSSLMSELPIFAKLLLQLSCDLRMTSYVDHYFRDWPELAAVLQDQDTSQISPDQLKCLHTPIFFEPVAPSIYNWLYKLIVSPDSVRPFPNLSDVCETTKQSILLFVVILSRDLPNESLASQYIKPIVVSGHRPSSTNTSLQTSLTELKNGPHYERAVLLMTKLGLESTKQLDMLAPGIVLPLRDANLMCRPKPPLNWPVKAYNIIGREDIYKQLDMENQNSKLVKRWLVESTVKPKDEDGMENIGDKLARLRFKDDLRIGEVRRLLQSCKPVKIAVTQRPEVSDHDFIEEQERHLYMICSRTMALSVGRGMLTLCTYVPVDTETLPVPKLCLSGRAPPRNTAVDLSHIDTPSNMEACSSFHNGVAAGLRIANTSSVDSTWIVYNKPKGSEMTNEHAGFLMALGLNGHLSNLAVLNVHEYLCKGHEMTSIALLLGIAAEKRGTMDVNVMRLLSIHVSVFLPPSSTELDVPHSVQVAAILGTGFLYQNSAHRHVVEVLLSEINRPPGPDCDSCTDREGYSLAAGLALGLVTMGKGGESHGLSELTIADTLHLLMVGGHKQQMTAVQREHYRSLSSQTKEGDMINVNVTSPGATLALGMMFFNTENSTVAQWLCPPDTQFLLEFVRPDFLLLRVLSYSLVMWSSVSPTIQWVNSTLPDIVSMFAFQRSRYKDDPSVEVDFETMSQAYCNIVAGACMAVGLKFAGSHNQSAFNTLKGYVEKFMGFLTKPLLWEQAGKSVIESCLMTIVVSWSMVMCGSGDLKVLKTCRHLRSRVGTMYNYVLYGSHMMVSMATSLLFLGGCRYSLSTKPDAIAAMLCAFFPKYPTHSNDNRYHQQAFRHLYVLAAEMRIIIPKDSTSGAPCHVPLKITLKPNNIHKLDEIEVMAPCIIPEIDIIDKLEVVGDRYWPIQFEQESNWQQLKTLLEFQGILFVKQRAGQLTYSEDPKGYRSLVARSLTKDQSGHKTIKPEVIKSFTSDSRVMAFVKNFCNSENSTEYELSALMSVAIRDCVVNEKLELLPSYLFLRQVSEGIAAQSCNNIQLSQVKLMKAYCQYREDSNNADPKTELINPEYLISVSSHIDHQLNAFKTENETSLLQYNSGQYKTSTLLCHYLTWNNIPCPSGDS